MSITFPELPGWSFDVEEVSVGVYEVVGGDSHGRRIQMKGMDPDALLQEARDHAIKIMREVNARFT